MKEHARAWVAAAAVLAACAGAPAGESGGGGAEGRAAPASPAAPEAPASTGASVLGGSWPTWRGFAQEGRSLETGLLKSFEVGGEGHLWSYEVSGRGTPVIHGGRVFGMGYRGEGPELQEVLFCLDEASGKPIWEIGFSDFLSDSVYERYSISSPVVDVETGNIVYLTTPGLFGCVTREGESVWQHSLMSEFGRLTFPNSRTGAPIIDGDLVISHSITAHWGPEGPARDRMYAFEKATGRHVWTSTPGENPIDNSLANPVFDWVDGRRVLYFTTGCGSLACIDARSGDPLWRYKMCGGGMNSTVVLHGDKVIAIHGSENLDTSSIGRMVAVKAGAEPAAGQPGPVVLGREAEVWRNDLDAFSSSPVIVGDRVYQTTSTGELACVDAETGAVLWRKKLATDQIHASPLAADGVLYVPMNSGAFFVVRPTDEGPEVLCEIQLEGNCLGAPAIAGGRIYVHTTERLYCFGKPGPGVAEAWDADAPEVAPGPGARLQVVPGDLLLRPGESVALDVHALDALGATAVPAVLDVTWAGPPNLDLAFESRALDDGVAAGWVLRVPETARTGSGVVKATAGELTGGMRVRVAPALDYAEDFEGFELTENEAGVPFAHPSGFWVGGRLKWDVREIDGSKVLAKTLHTPLFQRSLTFFGHAGAANYTMQADIRTDGSRRTMSTAGLLHQRYLIALKGNHQELEVSSNIERLQQAVPFEWKPDDLVHAHDARRSRPGGSRRGLRARQGLAAGRARARGLDDRGARPAPAPEWLAGPLRLHAPEPLPRLRRQPQSDLQ